MKAGIINNVNITEPASQATLTLASSYTFATSGNDITLTATGSTNVTLPTSGTLMVNPMTTAGDVIYGGASGVPTRLGIGTALQVLRTNAGATAIEWAAISSGGLLIAEDSGYGLNNGSTGRGTVGTEAVSLEYSTSGSTYGATGQYSFAAGYQTTASGIGSIALGGNSTASAEASFACGQSTASGLYSFSSGSDTTASGDYSFSSGSDTTASGDYSFAAGYQTTASGDYSFSSGYITTASGLYSFSSGSRSLATHYAENAHASGNFIVDGDCQNGKVQARASTVSTDETELFLDGSSVQFTLEDNDAYTCRITFMGAQADGSVGDAVYQVKIHRQGTTTALSQSVRTILAWDGDTNLGTPTVAITADDTNEALKITVTPANTTATRWTAVVEYVKINY